MPEEIQDLNYNIGWRKYDMIKWNNKQAFCWFIILVIILTTQMDNIFFCIIIVLIIDNASKSCFRQMNLIASPAFIIWIIRLALLLGI